MAASDKNILISPQRGSATLQPSIVFTGDGNNPITLSVLDGSVGTVSFSGSAGQLFSITNNLTSGSIFSVNDVSGIPSIDVDANGTIELAPFGGNVAVGKTTASSKLDVNGTVTATAFSGPVTVNATTTAVSKTIAVGEYCTVTAAGQTITLPASPSAGNQVAVGVLNFTNTIVARNAVNIMSLAENITLDIANSLTIFIYVDASVGWKVVTM